MQKNNSSDVLITNESKISEGLIIPCFFNLMTSCESQELFLIHWMIPRVKICSKKIDISGSTGCKKSLETGKYSLPQGSACSEYFTDALNILIFKIFFFNVCLHNYRQSHIMWRQRRREMNMLAFKKLLFHIFILLFWVYKNNLKPEIVDALLNIESAIEQVKFHKQANAKQSKVTIFFLPLR